MQQRGFTLIELSIVLVIIGLIVGGVLVGQDLIKAAQIRATVAQIEKYKTAVNTFKLKYNCIPGDCNNAVKLGLGTTGGPGDNGNGDFSVDGSLTGINGTVKESFNFWYHLSKANLIDGGFAGYPGDETMFAASGDLAPYVPTAKINERFWVSNWFNEIGNNGFFLFDYLECDVTPGDGGIYHDGPAPYESFMIDSKADDGFPTTGTIMSYGVNPGDGLENIHDSGYITGYLVPSQGTGGATSNFCVANNTTPYTYNILNTSRAANTLCMLYIKGDF